MTDNLTTELRKKLTERGIEYKTNDHMGSCETSWNGFTATQLSPNANLIMAVTPDQVIAATLGSDTCHMSFVDEYETASGEEEYLCECSECGYRRWEPACDLPLFCSKCGRKVKR